MASNKISGWLRQRMRADGMTWLWCYQKLRPSDGKMVENAVSLGLVSEVGDDEPAAWMKVGSRPILSRNRLAKARLLSSRSQYQAVVR